MMFCYKILPCKKTFRHDWRVCPFAHGDETAKRRDPRAFKYTGVICPDAKKGRSCPRGDDCPCTHSLFEYWLHPTRFKTEICSRGSRCNRPFCFFAHKQSEIRKPNFRVQMQGITCEPMQHHLTSSSMTGSHLNSHCMHRVSCAAAAAKRVPCLETAPSPIFQSTVLSSLEDSNVSLPDSGSSSGDVELSTGTWNSFLGSDSPRTETPLMHATNNGYTPHDILSSTALGPMFPQIPPTEHNAVDWSMRHSSAAKRQGSSKISGFESMWSPHRLGNSIGMSPRFVETRNVARNLKGTNSKIDNGYDRNYLLATIQDVYQSMLSGCYNDQQSMPLTHMDRQYAQRHASFGLTGIDGNGFYGTSGTCGLEGLQQNGCVSPHGMSFCPTNEANSLERTLYTLLRTDSSMESRYFK